MHEICKHIQYNYLTVRMYVQHNSIQLFSVLLNVSDKFTNKQTVLYIV